MRAARISWAAVSCCIAMILVFCSALAFAQTDSGTVSGRVLDPAGRSVPGAKVRLIDIDRGTAEQSATNNAGLYTFRAVHPGRYRMEVEARGFRLVNITGLTVNTQANLEQNFSLSIGSVSESVTVEAKATEISTSVNTIVDRQFVENLPLNGRSFQSLIQLTPGVVVTPTSNSDSGQFSVNGQRATANYWTIDGVSANIGASFNNLSTQNASGALPGFSVLGGTNNLVSVDAMQEFRIQTSTYAPEFGRTPGGQISIETRSGTNQFHGTVFEYLRNDALDSKNWFNGIANPPLKKSQERQNDFGFVLGGPIMKDRTFFFLSYEGEILRLPRTSISEVPSLQVRQDPSTPPAIAPLLNAYPLPNGADLGNGFSSFDASFSDRSTLQATSFRLDHRIGDHLALFGRYNFSPSELLTRGDGVSTAVNDINRVQVKTETLTAGAVWSPAASITDDFRFNYSRNRASGNDSVDSFGGAVVPAQSFFVSPQFAGSSSAGQYFLGTSGTLRIGPSTNSLQRQINIVDSVSLQRGRHSLKAGIDFRRLTPDITQPGYSISTSFFDIPSALALQPGFVFLQVTNPVTTRFYNIGSYFQDTWKAKPQLSITYGFRWDVDVAPSTAHGPDFLSFDSVNDPASIGLAPLGTSVFKTRYGNIAPRVGIAYLLSRKHGHETVLRGGFGIFYDLATTQTADLFSQVPEFPFGAVKICSVFLSDPDCGSSLTFPLPSQVAQPPAIASSPSQTLIGYDPNLALPYTMQWNIALEQSLGDKQSISASYIGAVGRRLLQQQQVVEAGRVIEIIGNHATSDYHALQIQFQRHMGKGLEALGSYSWAHSIDSGSSSSATGPNAFVGTGLPSNFNRGPSDFDVRHSFSAGVTYDLPTPKGSWVLRSVAGGWSLDSMIQGRTAPPVNVTDDRVSNQFDAGLIDIRPDLVPGQPLYLHGSECKALSGGVCAGGKMLNPAAFADPPLDPNTFLPLRPGTLGRNALRGFGAFQLDLALRRTFALGESMHLELKAEAFNVLNHPNFANPVSDLFSSFFGQSIQTLNQGLSGATIGGGGGFSPIYQIGGPRSAQLAAKVRF
jgi:carboxypeptidase family protein